MHIVIYFKEAPILAYLKCDEATRDSISSFMLYKHQYWFSYSVLRLCRIEHHHRLFYKSTNTCFLSVLRLCRIVQRHLFRWSTNTDFLIVCWNYVMWGCMVIYFRKSPTLAIWDYALEFILQKCSLQNTCNGLFPLACYLKLHSPMVLTLCHLEIN